jgi:hypothetical protein
MTAKQLFFHLIALGKALQPTYGASVYHYLVAEAAARNVPGVKVEQMAAAAWLKL